MTQGPKSGAETGLPHFGGDRERGAAILAGLAHVRTGGEEQADHLGVTCVAQCKAW